MLMAVCLSLLLYPRRGTVGAWMTEPEGSAPSNSRCLVCGEQRLASPVPNPDTCTEVEGKLGEVSHPRS